MGYEAAHMPWRTAILRGTKVFARCDAAGALLDEQGKVEIRYRANDARAYHALRRNLGVVPGDSQVWPDEHCGEAAPVAQAPEKKKSESKPRAKSTRDAPEVVDSAGQVIAYTDGACSGNPGPAGLGVVLIQAGARRELSEYLGVGTNNIAELSAILRALEAMDGDEPLVVHTDSQYAIGVLTKNWKAKANQELIARIKQRMQAVPRLRLVYVPGHAGVPLNERADALAVEAVRSRRNAGWVNP
jgi:ribonuclease HI